MPPSDPLSQSTPATPRIGESCADYRDHIVTLRGLGRELQLSHGVDGVKVVLLGPKRKIRPMLVYATAEPARVRLHEDATPCLWLDRTAFDLAVQEVGKVREFLGLSQQDKPT